MSNFKELMLPGCISGIEPKLWYVESATTTEYLLNNKIGLAEPTEPISAFYFMSRLEAFIAMEVYYHHNDEVFPYDEEIDKISISDKVKESQVMEFI